ncbi:MAG: tRNA pseudouridine(38-40) synthase TruA [Ferruginibacter sp.]
MQRYFIEVFYNGANYSGFQIQQNANSIQAEIEKALKIFFKEDFFLTGSSRTDAGVHALSNFFHFESEAVALLDILMLNRSVYNLNAILPEDIVVKRIFQVSPDAHCRFDAISREYKYHIYKNKDPFQADRAYYYPFKLDIELLQQAAAIVSNYKDFTSFSKRNTQVSNFQCSIIKSNWVLEKKLVIYNVQANRFLRGMVRGLVGTMLKVGTGKISVDHFVRIIEAKDCSLADFAVPPQGLFLVQIQY